MEMTPNETRVHRSGFPNDLRGEKHKAELSGPVRISKTIVELLPKRSRTGMFVTITTSAAACFNLSRAATNWLLSKGDCVRLKVDQLTRRIIITPDPNGPWKARTVKSRGALVSIGSQALRRELARYGIQPGRYEARVEGDSLIVEAGR